MAAFLAGVIFGMIAVVLMLGVVGGNGDKEETDYDT